VITHPEKVLFPDDGITKGDLAAYYEMIAPIMLPHILRRPVTMERFPAGIGKKGFLQKNVSTGFPEWLQRVEIPKKDGVVHHPIVTDTRSLLWLVNQNSITPHVWTSRAPEVYYPDICVFDLDPSVDDQGMLVAAAVRIRELLDELGLPSWVKTSGSKGFHIVVPLDGKTNMEEVARFAHTIGSLLVRQDPKNLTRSIEGIESLWIPAVTAGVQLTPHPTLFARSPVPQYPHPARGKSWSALMWALEPLRCGTWRRESEMSAICGRACEDGEDRWSVHC